ncbi:hypothetical protein ACFONL_09600 [Camelimonas fluminis]|uniref:Uncharacterized protein n=1 Tax=Camelimonas fluminis TaxID=1576911 RepID=A0ABV7UGB2_9HYPH|nr:hypothetical protein [Camelimonas fluminis]
MWSAKDRNGVEVRSGSDRGALAFAGSVAGARANAAGPKLFADCVGNVMRCHVVVDRDGGQARVRV